MRSAHTEKRGVYVMECLSPEGFPLVIAVTADNRRVMERVLWPFETEGDVVEEVWTELHRLDPMEPWKGGK